MTKKLILLRSVTYAYKAKERLARRGITAVIRRTPASLSKCGCGYSILVRKDSEQICRLLEADGIHVLGVAEADEDENWSAEG